MNNYTQINFIVFKMATWFIDINCKTYSFLGTGPAQNCSLAIDNFPTHFLIMVRAHTWASSQKLPIYQPHCPMPAFTMDRYVARQAQAYSYNHYCFSRHRRCLALAVSVSS